MIDIAKVADLVLLLIDASFGFEMETFEFLNVLQSHGFPKIMGVLTHLDKFKDNKKLRRTKKTLKQRFWTEIYKGAKLFYLSGMINGQYPKNEVLNLSRFISIMKFRPLIWRNTHPYMLADRIEDLTDPEQVRIEPKCDRTMTFYGYLRGTNMKQGSRIHIPGLGDNTASTITILPDPCPIPDKTRKLLSEKSKLIYAPQSDVSGILYDKDAVYINVPGVFTKQSADGKETGNLNPTEGEKILMDLQDAKETFEDQIKSSELKIFQSSTPLKAIEIQEEVVEDDSGRKRRKAIFSSQINEEEDFDSDLSNADSDGEPIMNIQDDDMEDDHLSFADSDSDMGDDFTAEEASAAKWKTNLVDNAKQRFSKGQSVDLMELVYGDNATAAEEAKDELVEEDGLFTIKKRKVSKKNGLTSIDSTKLEISDEILKEWESEEVCL
jgi:ribosome biogenesis protein BMS1